MIVTLSSTPCLDRVHRDIMLRNAHAIFLFTGKRYMRSTLWAFVSDITGVGSTSACEICKELGWNPHAPAKDQLPR